MAFGSYASVVLVLLVLAQPYMGQDGFELTPVTGDDGEVRVRREVEPGDGQIIALRLKCPDQDIGKAKLTIIHDGDVFAKAHCKNGNFTFERVDIAHLELTMTLNKTRAGVCEMWKSSKINKAYHVIVSYSSGTNSSGVFWDYTKENAICNYDDTGISYGNITRITRPFTRPRDKPIYRGGAIRQKIKMEVIDVLDRPLRRKSISMSRLIRLRATIQSQVYSIYALSCVAMNKAGAKYKIIRGSCGDGKVLKYNDGFVTRGNITYSPYFKVFRLAGSYNLRFRCTFGSCKTSECDNRNSCPYSKARYTTPAIITLPPAPTP